ncbi:MAG: electron transfer flavoprotein subunit alpha/FixB family protein, partial [Thermodesulfobacteriota bacterium]|nr:electron transfer flavoprotein subunit alpha/FixB family protein [Thermodesulfobacteriota bacterium]
MARQVFAYIVHKEGVADDTAFEMVAAAKRIDPDASITAIVTGIGDNLNAVCNEIASSYQEVWKIDNEALSYPNAEVIRTLLVRILPEAGTIIIPYDTFGMDLAPGLSIKLEAAYLPDAVDIEGVDENMLKAVRQEYGGQVSTHVVCDISGGAVITIRPGPFKAEETKGADCQVVDKTAEALKGGFPETGRRFIEIVEAEVGDV